MSRLRHSPRGDVVRLGGVRRMRPEAHGSTAGRSFARGAVAGIFAAAIVVGIGTGAVLSRQDPPQAVPTAVAQVVQPKAESVAPAPVADAQDRQWAERGSSSVIASHGEAIQPGFPRAKGARNDGARVAFSYCKWGGGTNCVVDGDTFWIGGQKVRIAGIDAPETHDYRCKSELELGEQAARQLQALLNSGAVTMTSIDRDRDRYGRLLRNVQVGGQDVGDALISAGVVRAYAGGRRPWC